MGSCKKSGGFQFYFNENYIRDMFLFLEGEN